MASLIPRNRFGSLKAEMARERRSKSKPNEQIDESLASSIGKQTLGLVGAVGNFLDVPGSTVRNTLAGKNPFAALANPLSDEGRISGRELSRQYGFAGKEDNWQNFFGGLAVEMGTDPLTLSGFSALGKTAKGLSMARQGVKGASTLAKGIQAGERALAAGRVPFTKAHWAVGTGKTAQKIGQKLDTAYDAIRDSGAGRQVSKWFDRTAGNVSGKIGQKFARRISPQFDQLDLAEKTSQLSAAEVLKRHGLTNAEEVRHMLETGARHPAEEVNRALDRMVGSVDEKFAQRQALGQVKGKLQDRYIRHIHRQASKGKGGMRQFAGNAPQWAITGSMDRKRKWVLKNFREGTKGVNAIVKDPGVSQILKNGESQQKTWSEVHKELTRHLHGLNGTIGLKKPQLDANGSLVNIPQGKIFDPFEVSHAKGEPRVISRAAGLAAYLMGKSDDTLKNGLYSNYPIVDLHNAAVKSGRKAIIGKELNRTILEDLAPESIRVQAGKWQGDLPATGGKVPYVLKKSGDRNIGSMLKELGHRRPKESMARILAEAGIEPTDQNLFELLNTTVKEGDYNDLTSVYAPKTKPSGPISRGVKSYLNLWKAAALSHPSTQARNAISGQLHNAIHGAGGLRSSKDALDVYRGQSIKGLQDLPWVREWAGQQGLPLNDATATEALRYRYASEGPGGVALHHDLQGASPESGQLLDSVLADVPGHTPNTLWGNIKDVGRTFAGKAEGSTWNPLKATVNGVGDATETSFAPFAGFNKTAQGIEHMNRLSPFINLVKQGYDPTAAMKMVNDLQVNYSPNQFTKTEQALKQIFPFYSFTSKTLRKTAHELATNPGGGLANTVRLQNAARDRSGTTPDYIADNGSIRLPYESEDGTRRYLSGVGMMSHDDALQFMQPSPQQVGLELLSRLAPQYQQPLSLATGTSFWQKGPEGGRPINEMTPTIGQLIANATGQEDAVRYPGDWAAETALQMSPFTRLATTARQMTDPRRSVPERLGSVLLGAKLNVVSPEAQERALRRKVESAAKDAGARSMSEIYFPKSIMQNPRSAEVASRYKGLLRSLEARKKARDKKKAKKT